MAFHKKTRRLKTVLWTASFHDKTEEIPFPSRRIVKLTMLIMVGRRYGLSERSMLQQGPVSLKSSQEASKCHLASFRFWSRPRIGILQCLKLLRDRQAFGQDGSSSHQGQPASNWSKRHLVDLKIYMTIFPTSFEKRQVSTWSASSDQYFHPIEWQDPIERHKISLTSIASIIK